MYAPVGGVQIATAAAIRAATSNFSAQVWFSLERIGWASERTGADWALPGGGSGLAQLASSYDLVIAQPQALRGVTGRLPAGARVVLLLDEWMTPPDAALSAAALIGACSECALAHFDSPHAKVRLMPPPYEASLFAPYVTAPPARAACFFPEKRSLHTPQLRDLFSSYGLAPAPRRESWTYTGDMTYADWLRRLGACRWVVAIDAKRSAGQARGTRALPAAPSPQCDLGVISGRWWRRRRCSACPLSPSSAKPTRTSSYPTTCCCRATRRPPPCRRCATRADAGSGHAHAFPFHGRWPSSTRRCGGTSVRPSTTRG